jgi:hypothetical protein
LKEAGGGAQDFLAGFLTGFLAGFLTGCLTRSDGSFAEHLQRWYRGMGSALYQRISRLAWELARGKLFS